MRQSNTGHPLVYQYSSPRVGHYYRVAIRRRDEVIRKHFSWGSLRTQEAALRAALAWRDEQVKLHPITDAAGRLKHRGLPSGVSLNPTYCDVATGLPVGYSFRVTCYKKGKQTQPEFRLGLAGEITLSRYRAVRREVVKFHQMVQTARKAGVELDIDQLARWVRTAIHTHPTNPQRNSKKALPIKQADQHMLRIAQAENLLRSTKMEIRDIAMEVGYATAPSFRVWWQKKHPDVHPTEFRRLHINH